MKRTKTWGLISSNAEQYMMSHAERHMNKIQKKKPTGQRLPAKNK